MMYDTPIYQQLFREGRWDVPVLEPSCRRVDYNRSRNTQRYIDSGEYEGEYGKD